MFSDCIRSHKDWARLASGASPHGSLELQSCLQLLLKVNRDDRISELDLVSTITRRWPGGVRCLVGLIRATLRLRAWGCYGCKGKCNSWSSFASDLWWSYDTSKCHVSWQAPNPWFGSPFQPSNWVLQLSVPPEHSKGYTVFNCWQFWGGVAGGTHPHLHQRG